MSTEHHQQTSIVVVSPNNREAKKVIDYKTFNGQRYYKVKWESSWELEDSLTDYQYLVDQFWDFVKRVSNEDTDDPARKRPRLNEDENGVHDDDSTVNNSEEENQIKGTITLSDGVKIQESGNFYRLTQEKESSVDENDGSVFILQGSHTGIHSKSSNPRINKSNVHVIGLQHDPKSEARKKTSEDGSTEDRKFLCDVCGMAFRRNDIRRRHEITHSKEYRYFCAICGKGFIRRYVLVKHLLRDHESTDSRKIVYQKNKKKFDEDGLNNTELKEELSSQSLEENLVKKEAMHHEEEGEEMEGEGGGRINVVADGDVEDDGDDESETVQIRIERQQQDGSEPMDENADILYVSRANAESIHVANALLAAAAGEVPARIANDPVAVNESTVTGEDESDQPVSIEVQMIT